MREKVRAFMEQYHMVTAGERVLLGLRRRGFRLPVSSAAGTAGAAWLFRCWLSTSTITCAARKPAGCGIAENLCREYDVPFYLYSCPVEKIAKEKHLSTEEAGRAARQEVFAACAKEQRAVKIALAHHQDDVAETMLHHLGTGNVADRTCLPYAPCGGSVIRPLLCVGRKEIRQELESRK